MKSWSSVFRESGLYYFVLYTAGGGWKNMGLKKSTCPQHSCCAGCLPLLCPRRDPEVPVLTFLNCLNSFCSWTLIPQANQLIARHCRLNLDWHLKVNQSVLVNIKVLISDRTWKYRLQTSCFDIKNMKISPYVRKMARQKFISIASFCLKYPNTFCENNNKWKCLQVYDEHFCQWKWSAQKTHTPR